MTLGSLSKGPSILYHIMALSVFSFQLPVLLRPFHWGPGMEQELAGRSANTEKLPLTP